jgi:hypothetical protein
MADNLLKAAVAIAGREIRFGKPDSISLTNLRNRTK